jgi:hypothetical protein
LGRGRAKETADLSGPLGRKTFPGRGINTEISPLRYASVEMTKERAALPWRAASDRRRFSSLWVGRRAMTPQVEMTILFEGKFRIFEEKDEASPNKIVISTGAYPDFLPRSPGHGHVCGFR